MNLRTYSDWLSRLSPDELQELRMVEAFEAQELKRLGGKYLDKLDDIEQPSATRTKLIIVQK
jgi:hypothetical protein